MKKLHYLVGLLICISCTQNQKSTPSEKETYKIVLECDDSVCPDEFLSENIQTEKLPEVHLTHKKRKQLKKESNNKSWFKFPSNESVTLIAKNKTKVSIPPNSFRYAKTGEMVSGKVTLEIKEYYKKSDFILANLTSQTKDKLLESRGMIYISAKANGKECRLIDGRQMKIEFPTKKFEKGFNYFEGQPDENNDIVWSLEKTEKEDRPNFNRLNPRIINAQNQRVNVSFHALLDRNGGYRGNNLDNHFSNWLVKEFVKNFKDKNLSQYQMSVLRGCGNSGQYIFTRNLVFDFDTTAGSGIDKSNISVKNDYFLELKKALRKIPSDVCYKGLKPNQKHKNMISIKVQIDTRGGIDINKFKKEYAFADNVGYFDYVSIYANKLKWINCDRFMQFKPEELTPMYVDMGDAEEIEAKLVFKKYNSVLKGQIIDNKIVFNNIPKNEEVYIVATKKVKGENYFTVTPTKVSTNLLSLPFQKYTKKRYTKALEILNNS